ncbi:MAG: GNAT family N-acetyltransferase [Bacilli bacterium]|nr:GNAT family N-acetyltransferase [Bacilli bacterium]
MMKADLVQIIDEKECASLGPIMVSKDYVGNKLQLQMVEELEKYCRNNNYKYIFTKVASDNKYSLSNMLNFGFKIMNEYINERGKNSTLIREIK